MCCNWIVPDAPTALGENETSCPGGGTGAVSIPRHRTVAPVFTFAMVVVVPGLKLNGPSCCGDPDPHPARTTAPATSATPRLVFMSSLHTPPKPRLSQPQLRR